jgi:hypothetical protein
MKEFLLLFRNISGNGNYITTPQDMAEDMPAWQAWIGNIAMQGKLVSTHPIEYKGTIVHKTGVDNGPHIDPDQLLIAGYLICKAEQEDEVIGWSRNCPILKYPHGSVEIRPVIPFPNL